MTQIRCFLLEQTERRINGGRVIVWRRGDTGEEFHLGDVECDGVPPAPPGAMWYADWYPDSFRTRSPDGRVLIIRTPASDWNVDGPASNCPGWTRTGTPPNVSATPSIGQYNADGSFKYHGWLRNGVLVEC
jgi:hypothetical protein